MPICMNSVSIWLGSVPSRSWASWQDVSLKYPTCRSHSAANTSLQVRAGFSDLGFSKIPASWVGPIAVRRRNIELQDEDEDVEDWESDIFEDFDRSGGKSQQRDSGEEEQDEDEEEKVDEWASKARERAILSIQSRGLPVASLLDVKKTKKKDKKKRKKKQMEDGLSSVSSSVGRLAKSKSGGDEGRLHAAESSSELRVENPFMKALGSGGSLQELAGVGNYWKNLGSNGGVEFQILKEATMEDVELIIQEDLGTVTQQSKNVAWSADSRDVQKWGLSGRQQRQDDFDLNRKLVEAGNATDVLSLVGSVMQSNARGSNGSPLSSLNISTALHRVAKHMETVSFHKSDRLSFSRQKIMAQLVSAATESLSLCSAQSISNIAWAFSKVGGSSLYWAEMDLLAEAALMKISDLQPQHIANIAGAFASMQHSVPSLFQALDYKASIYHRNFQPQELAQLLWAFATLDQPANLLLDSLDSECDALDLERIKERSMTSGPFVEDKDDALPNPSPDTTEGDAEGCIQNIYAKCNSVTEVSSSDPDRSSETVELSNGWTSPQIYFGNFTLSELASLSWSYTVLEQLKRPSFALIWSMIDNQGQGPLGLQQAVSGQSMQLSQLYQVTLSLELEYPDLGLALGQSLRKLALSEWERLKEGIKSTSVTQKDVETILVGTGRNWVGEYRAACYSLDAALVEERIALEIDGPSHFTRNTGTPLGHTVLKRRQLAAAGWTVLSIPYQEWDDLLGEEEQTMYVRNLLRSHL